MSHVKRFFINRETPTQTKNSIMLSLGAPEWVSLLFGKPICAILHMSYSLNSSQGGYVGEYCRGS